MPRELSHWENAMRQLLLSGFALTLAFNVPVAAAQANVGGCNGLAPVPLVGPTTLTASARIIDAVPAYSWYHGCGPTAAASVIGYWDLHGFPGLFNAQGAEVFLTSNVQDQISSPAHNAKYDPDPDAPGPVPPLTSIADGFRTSVNMPFGWSFFSDAVPAFSDYATYRGYDFNAQNVVLGFSFSWQDLVSEIDANRPLMFLVDTNADSATDHFVPVLGYDDRGAAGRFYGLYTTWSEDETIVWQPFEGVGRSWGVYGATLVHPVTAAIPEPPPYMLLSLGLLVLVLLRGCGSNKTLRVT